MAKPASGRKSRRPIPGKTWTLLSTPSSAQSLSWASKSPLVSWNFSATIAACMETLFQVVHECDDLLVINKPAGLVCHPTKGDVYSSLISRARLYLAENSNPELINRLDRETSGVVLIAKNAPTALELRRVWESREVLKSYLAIVHGHVVPAA